MKCVCNSLMFYVLLPIANCYKMMWPAVGLRWPLQVYRYRALTDSKSKKSKGDFNESNH